MFFDRWFSSKRTKEASPVDEFCKELGLDFPAGNEEGQQGWFMRMIKAAHGWTNEDSAVTAVTAVFVAAAVTFVAVFVAAVFVAFVTAFAVAAFVAYSSSKKGNRTCFYFFLMELAVIAVVGAFLRHPAVSSVPFSADLLIWLANGIRLMSKSPEQPAVKPSAEELVGSAFERFLARHRPDLSNEKSALGQRLTSLDESIKKSSELLARLRGELRADEMQKGGRKEAIQTEIQSFELWIEGMLRDRSDLEQRKNDLLGGLQFLEAVKDEALSYVRFRSLQEEVEAVRGESGALMLQADEELETIRARIAEGLIRINTAVERLGLSAVSSESGDLRQLYAHAERIGERAVEGDRVVRKLSVM